MQPSLSVVLPLHNAQAALAARVEELLEILPEMTSRVEVALVNDGSTDATSELAHELSLRYPQIRHADQPERLGLAAAWVRGVEATSGAVVLLCHEMWMPHPHDVVKLYHDMAELDIAFAMPAGASRGWLTKMRIPSRPEEWPAVVIRRPTLVRAIRRGHATEWIAALGRLGYNARQVEVRSRPITTLAGPRPETVARWQAAGDKLARKMRADSPSWLGQRRRRPNYLGKLRSFALGE